MKRTLLFLGLASVMSAFTGCTKDEVSDNAIPSQAESSNAPKTLVAQMGEEGSRAALTPNGKSLVWKAGDALSIYAGDQANHNLYYELNSGADTSVGEFKLQEEGTITPLPYGGYEDEGGSNPRMAYAAVYPSDLFYYNMDAPAGTPGVPVQIGAKIPENQTYTPDTFDPMAFPLLGLFKTNADPVNIKFKYLAALVKIPLTGDQTLTQIELNAKKGTLDNNATAQLSGPVYYQFEADSPDADKAENIFFGPDPLNSKMLGNFGAKTTSVKLNGNMTLTSTPQNFYMVVLAGIYAQGNSSAGFDLTFTHADESQILKRVTSSVQGGGDGFYVNPGEVVSLPEMNLMSAYMPALTVDGTTINWTPGDENLIDSYSLTVTYGEADLFTLDKVQPGDFATKINEQMNAFVGLVGAKNTVNLKVTVKAVFKQATEDNPGVNPEKTIATVSAPANYSYTAPDYPEIVASVKAGNYYYLAVSNLGDFGKMEYAFLEGADLSADAFSSTPFTTVTNPYATNLVLSTNYGMSYTVMLKGYDKDSKTEVKKTKLISWTIKLPEPGFNLNTEYLPADSFYPAEFHISLSPKNMPQGNYITTFQVTTATLYWIEGTSDAEHADWSGNNVQHSAIDNLQNLYPGMSNYVEFTNIYPALDGTKKYAFKMVCTGTFPDGVTEDTGLGSYSGNTPM